MNNDNIGSDELKKSALDLATALERLDRLPGMGDEINKKHCQICLEIPEQIKAGTLNLAVVGAIKSGKSTFINSLLGREILKRGAGVVTAVTTRIRRGDDLKAEIFFKSWDEINQEIEAALRYFPHGREDFDTSGFDMRRERDRLFLRSVNRRLLSDISITDQGIRPESAVISQAVNGYDRVKDLLGADAVVLTLEGSRFQEHKGFTGDQDTAFFVQDALLTLPLDALDSGVELADCQGCDSTDPAHMLQIQEYLFSSHLILYVISSRTGLREADVRFLNIINKMGLTGNILFILNVDLNEHDDLEGLHTLEQKVRRDLYYFSENPPLFLLSSLYNLLEAGGEGLSSKEAGQLQLWEKDQEITTHLKTETRLLLHCLTRKTIQERSILAVSNPLETLHGITLGALKRLTIFSDLLSEDHKKREAAVSRLEEMNQSSRKLETILTNSLEGAVNGLRRDILEKINAQYRDSIMVKVAGKIKSYRFDEDLYTSWMDKNGFPNAVFHMFQDFRTWFTSFIADEINPEILSFIRDQETHMVLYLKTIFDTFEPSRITSDFPEIRELIPDPAEKGEADSNPVDIQSIKGILGIAPPKIVFSPRFNARIKVASMTRFGVHFFSRIFAGLSGKPLYNPLTAALLDAGKRIKKEMMESVKLYVPAHQELVKNYLNTLLDAVVRDFRKRVIQGFQTGDIRMGEMTALLESDRKAKTVQKEEVEAVELILERLRLDMEELRHGAVYPGAAGEKG